MADIVLKIAQGPKSPSGNPIWYGLPLSTPYDELALAGTEVIDGKRTGAVFKIAESWAGTH